MHISLLCVEQHKQPLVEVVDCGALTILEDAQTPFVDVYETNTDVGDLGVVGTQPDKKEVRGVGSNVFSSLQ